MSTTSLGMVNKTAHNSPRCDATAVMGEGQLGGQESVVCMGEAASILSIFPSKLLKCCV